MGNDDKICLGLDNMGLETIKRAVTFVVLCLLQVFFLNEIHLFGFATPFLYVYFLLSFGYDTPRWGILLWSFAMGLVLDTFTNTPGVAAASMTLMGLLQPYVLSLFVSHDAPDNFSPSLRSLGTTRYFYYSLFFVFSYCLVFFTLESFSFFNLLYWAECVGGSTVLTLLLILFIENIRRDR